MNISQKCNCCIKEDVCKLKEEYQEKAKQLKENTNENIEISVKCKFFKSKNNIIGERLKNNE